MKESLASPIAFLKDIIGNLPHEAALCEYEAWWNRDGKAISGATDRARTPWLKMFDDRGQRVDEILYAPEYWQMLKQGYRSGVLWRSFEDRSLLPAYLYIYVTGFFDPGLACPYTVSLATAVPLAKYADPEIRDRFLPIMLKRDASVWQGATWMTEIRGGSDLGANVETTARQDGSRWLLTGEKYFASNAGAELAVVAARPEGAQRGVRGVALFLVPRKRDNGRLNYTIRRLKDKIATRSVPTGEVELRESEGWLLGTADHGIYLILEVLNISRVANSMGSAALAQRAMSDALEFAQHRIAFGKPIIEQPMFARQFRDRLCELRGACSLAWYAVQLLNSVWQEQPPYSERYHLFRLVAHLAKYWTAEFAVQTSKWSMEAHGGLGVLEEFGVERWLREAMILAIWEGTAHRQVLDGLEVMERKNAHRLLWRELAERMPSQDREQLDSDIAHLLTLNDAEKQATADGIFTRLARLTSTALLA